MGLDQLVADATADFCDMRRRSEGITIDEYLARCPEEMRVKLRRALETVVRLDDLGSKARKAGISFSELTKPLTPAESRMEQRDADRLRANRLDPVVPYLEGMKLCALFKAPGDKVNDERREWLHRLAADAKKKPARSGKTARRRAKT